MRVGHKNSGNGWIDRNGRSGGVLTTQRKRCGLNDLAGEVWKIAGDSSERALPEIVKYTDAGAERGAPIGSAGELIRDSQSRRYVSIRRLVEPSDSRRQGYRGRIIHSQH